MAIQGSFPRSFLIPGTDTSIRVGGFIDETLDYYFVRRPAERQPDHDRRGHRQSGVDPTQHARRLRRFPGFPTPGNLVPQSTASSRGNGVFLQSPRETRLNVETRTPTAWGESRTFIEFDFAGTNNFSGQQPDHGVG